MVTTVLFAPRPLQTLVHTPATVACVLARPTTMIAAMTFLRLSRPRQWLKNLLVVAGPLSASEFSPSTIMKTAIAFVAMTLIAISGYVMNDLCDRVLDAEHAVRKHRPIASGAVSLSSARIFMGVTGAAALAVAALTARLTVVLSVGVYGVLTFSYSRWLKHIAVVELLVVTACIVLRTEVGAQATSVPLSRWFLLVVGFAALYVIASKRSAELLAGYDPTKTRPVLADYPGHALGIVRALASFGTVLAYCLWAYERSKKSDGGTFFALSAPFVAIGLLRFEFLVRSGRAGTVEDVMFDDPPFRWIALTWAVVFVVGAIRG